MKIKKILIANRGEIALRVISTCREMGIKTVTIYTESESSLPHALLSDEAICLGQGPLSHTYLNQNLLIDIAKKTNSDAIHPGYGFLSENPPFADLVEKSNIIFIGPSSESMKVMGDKKASKELIENIDVPSIPGYHGDNQDSDFLKVKANEIGYPVLIKASAGGGGKGMRVVKDENDFLEALESAKSEALKSFSNDIVLIEKYIENPRHIEVQVMSDSHENHLHFYERECSIQRRHQKIIEETPSPAVNPELRKNITKAATTITKYIKYRGAGTIEFILDEQGKFYFLEMNTRLQVEHPITEMVTGVDLVKLQILVAQGAPLNIKQEEIGQKGHSIEVRIYAEDPDNNFLPSIGTIKEIGSTKLTNVRLDCGYFNENKVTVDFDPMLAKLITYGSDRQSTILKMAKALEDFPFLGLKTNREYLMRILKNEQFEKGNTFTNFVELYKEDLQPTPLNNNQIAKAVASFLLSNQQNIETNSTDKKLTTPWDNLTSFRN